MPAYHTLAHHTLAIKREHYNVARKYAVELDLPSSRQAIIQMIEIASAVHLARIKENGRAHARSTPRQDR